MIDTSNWKEFVLGDLFDIKLPSARSEKNYEEGDVNYVSSGAFNNGVANRLKPKDDEELDKGHCITVSPLDGSAFWQENDFMGRGGSGASISMLYNDNLNDLRALFVCSIIRNTAQKFGYSDLLNSKNLRTLKLKLPATPDGQPDWDYMESYMKAVMEESEKSLENLKKVDDTKHLIDVSGWGEFKVGDLFKKLDLKCCKKFNKATDVSTEQTEEFNLPLVNAKHSNNGIMYYGRSDDWDSAEMTIDIVGDGAASTGDVYAQPQRTGVLYNAYLVKPLWDCTSEYVLQFMACVIERCVKSHFGYENKCTWDKVSQESIWLPIASTGKPDWQYMEDYMKQMMDKSEQIISDLQIGA